MLSTFVSIAFAAAAMQDAAVPTAPDVPRTQLVAPASAAIEPPVPEGAPRDDYGLVAWCHGALRGHMDLAELINDVEPLDAAQQAQGALDLKRYESALAAAAQSTTSEGAAAAEQARAAGLGVWTPVRAMNRPEQREKYLNWSLAGRCDHAAARLLGSSDLLGAAFKAGVSPAAAATTLAPAAAPAAPATQP
jgi:hypothetical protein